MNPVPAKAPNTIPEELIQQVDEFRQLCCSRYKFNSGCDNATIISGILISLGVVVCGIYNQPKIAAILGGLTTAVVSAQRAFPFGQRWQFYRLLESQADNLLMEARAGTVTVDQLIATMKSMRMDFAQQIPRASSARSDSDAHAEKTTPQAPPKQ
jgi:hypothetical protein